MTRPESVTLPPRYEVVRRLGKGGGGEVWAVRDVVDGRTYALKTLADNASERESLALVREASALSGLEGLGVPRVLRFGRLPGDGRPYMLRELVDGLSLAERLLEGVEPARALTAVVLVADQLTRLHRASLLHGDVKPANIIVGDDGSATLVDLGLASPWRERGQTVVGLSPGYAAPELFSGEQLTVRAEVYSLGATLRDVIERLRPRLPEAQLRSLDEVVERATCEVPSARFPSVDELASALRQVVGLVLPSGTGMADAAWPIVGLDVTVSGLLTTVVGLPAGAVIELQGRTGAGRTAVLRRLAWSLGIEGRAVAWIEGSAVASRSAVEAELAGCRGQASVVILVDDLERLGPSELALLHEARRAGAKLIVTSNGSAAAQIFGAVEPFVVPPLDRGLAASLIRRAIPSLNDAVVSHVVARAEGRPGRLRSLVRRLDGEPVMSAADVERSLAGRSTMPSGEDTAVATLLLDQGRLTEAAAVIARIENIHTATAGVLRARLFIGQNNIDAALRALDEIDDVLGDEPSEPVRRAARLYRARALLRRGKYQDAASLASESLSAALRERAQGDGVDADLLTCRGVAESYLGEHERAFASLTKAVAVARASRDRRVEALALASLALAQQRSDKLAEAKRSYEEALEAAEEAGDAGSVATIRLNLATIASSGQGEIAQALIHLEAAVDMGRRAGRAGTVQQALLNLANVDLYLGRLARAAASIDQLVSQRDELPAGSAAQLLGLEAELSARSGNISRAGELYEQCAAAYDALSRNVDAAEARIESVLVSARVDGAEPSLLASSLERAGSSLSGTPAHRALLSLARGVVAALTHDDVRARQALGDALSIARGEGQKEWVWRTLEARARLEIECGRPLAARRDTEEALSVLEDIAARLPRDLREVYWNDPRRRAIRSSVAGDSRHFRAEGRAGEGALLGSSAASTTRFLEEERLGRILEINRELAMVRDLSLVLESVVTHAVSLLQAERGYVLLTTEDGGLSVHSSRERVSDESHKQFSRSIAEQSIATGEPVVSMSARDDARMAAIESVHHLNIQSVACVPIRSPRGGFIGALYLETRGRPGRLFEREMPTIRAFADQAAVAIENARLLEQEVRHAAALEKTNAELEAAKERLRELLEHKKAQLESTRRDLKDTRAVLRGHFGYGGLVGTSAPMRKVYALVERVKDTDIPVLIGGESGTGKEMVARAIHEAGPRAKRPFTGVNYGAIPENLLESELFGHVRGAFTGADRDRRGLFRESEGGTLLLDEIGEMPLKMQAGLLRVLQERVVRPVGGTREEPIDVRVIAATNRDLLAMVHEGTFREDLYYRLRVVEISVPALRERPEDIPALIDHFLQIFAARYRREKGAVSREALRVLMAYPWQGNVRQLQNVLLNAWVLADNSELQESDFDLPAVRGPIAAGRRVTAPAVVAPERRASEDIAPPFESGASPMSHADHRVQERERILAALQASNWNRVRAAQALGMPRRTFYRRLKDYGIQ